MRRIIRKNPGTIGLMTLTAGLWGYVGYIMWNSPAPRWLAIACPLVLCLTFTLAYIISITEEEIK